MAVEFEQAVVATREYGEAIHGGLQVGGGGGVEGVAGFAGLKVQVGVLAGAPHHRLIGGESPRPVGAEGLQRDELLQGGVADQRHPLDFMGGAKAIKGMQHRNPGLQGGGGGDGGEVAGFLHAG